MTEEKKKGRLARLSERILAEPDNTPEESARLKADREALYGTGTQWAQLQDEAFHSTGHFTVHARWIDGSRTFSISSRQ